MTFEIGSLVRLRSGGPVMTVASVRVNERNDLAVALCTWFNDSMFCSQPFNVKMLEPAVIEPPQR